LVKQEEIFKIRHLNDESIRGQCKQRVKLHLKSINTNSKLHTYEIEEFKLRLLQFLNNIYTQKVFLNECIKTVVILIFKKCDRRNPQNDRGFSILNTCYKEYCKILNIKLYNYSA
jgi:hypothetical protein